MKIVVKRFEAETIPDLKAALHGLIENLAVTSEPYVFGGASGPVPWDLSVANAVIEIEVHP